MGRLCIPALFRAKLLDQVAQLFVGAALYAATQVYPNLGAVVPSDNRTVIDKGNLTPQARSRYRRTHTGYTGPDDYEVKLARTERFGGYMKLSASKVGKRVPVGRG